MVWSQLGTTIAGESAGDYSGWSVSLSDDGTIVAIGAYGNDKNGDQSGHVRIYKYTNGSWTQLGDDIDGDAAGDYFGESVSLSADGTILAIGAEGDDYAGAESGSVSIYQYSNNSWNQLGNFIEGDNAGDFFGRSVSLSEDGTTVAIGAYGAYAEIWQYSNNSWNQLGDDIRGEYSYQNSFSVSLSADGTIVAIGEEGDDYSGTNSGSVSIYQYSNNSWNQLGDAIDGEAAGDYSGSSISLSEDGTIVAIGAYGNDANGDQSGHTSIFQYSNNSWTQLGDDIDGYAAGDNSGWSVSLSDDGKIVAIGAYGNDGNGDESGHVRIYKYTNGSWTQLGNDINGDDAGDNFGNSVSLSDDGTIIAIGADYSDDNGTNSGHVRTFTTQIRDGVEVAQANSSFLADPNGFSSVNGSAPVTITAYTIGQETTLDSIKDYDGYLHAGDNLAATASSYKYQGMLDVNGDGVFETIFTNKSSKRWVTAKVDSNTGQIDFDDNGKGGGTRVVGIYADPLIAVGDANGGFLSDGVTPAPAAFGATGSDRYVDLNGDGDYEDSNEDRLALNSQVRFQTDLENDNLTAKHSGDYNSDGIHEVYWKTNDGNVYLRSLMHADGNIRYANYQSEEQMSNYLTNNGYESVISDIV